MGQMVGHRPDYTQQCLMPDILTGELDPERIGSGIQYGDATLRRLNRANSQRSKAGAECMSSSCRI